MTQDKANKVSEWMESVGLDKNGFLYVNEGIRMVVSRKEAEFFYDLFQKREREILEGLKDEQQVLQDSVYHLNYRAVPIGVIEERLGEL